MAVIAALVELSQQVCDTNELHSCEWLCYRDLLRHALQYKDVKNIDVYLSKIIIVRNVMFKSFHSKAYKKYTLLPIPSSNAAS